MPRVTLRPATAEDEPFLRSLFALVRAEMLADIPLQEPQKTALIDMQFRAQRAHYQAADPDASYQIILLEGVPVGNLTVGDGDELCLIDINVVPIHQGQGIGTLIIQDLMARATEAEKPLALHVDQSNRARALYERLGFSAIASDGASIRMAWFPPGFVPRPDNAPP